MATDEVDEAAIVQNMFHPDSEDEADDKVDEDGYEEGKHDEGKNGGPYNNLIEPPDIFNML